MLGVKAIVGLERVYTYQSARPITAAPTATAVMPDGTVHALAAPTPLHAVVTIAAGGISDDARTLTATGAVAGAIGLQGQQGQAFLLTGARTPYAVRIAAVDGTAITLAEPLDPKPTLTDTARLVWAGWDVVLPAGTVCAAAVRNVSLRLDYTTDEGTDATPATGRVEVPVHVVRAPFTTGATGEDIIAVAPRVNTAAPARSQSFEGVLRVTSLRLEMRINADLAVDGAHADDILAPASSFRVVHAHMAAAEVLAGDEIESQRLEAIVWGRLDPVDGTRASDGLYAHAMRSLSLIHI
jgi:hypothetical protein